MATRVVLLYCTDAMELVPIISKVDDPNVEDKEAPDTRQYATCTGCIMTI